MSLFVLQYEFFTKNSAQNHKIICAHMRSSQFLRGFHLEVASFSLAKKDFTWLFRRWGEPLGRLLPNSSSEGVLR